jgi:hypothetical protein
MAHTTDSRFQGKLIFRRVGQASRLPVLGAFSPKLRSFTQDYIETFTSLFTAALRFLRKMPSNANSQIQSPVAILLDN